MLGFKFFYMLHNFFLSFFLIQLGIFIELFDRLINVDSWISLFKLFQLFISD